MFDALTNLYRAVEGVPVGRGSLKPYFLSTLMWFRWLVTLLPILQELLRRIASPRGFSEDIKFIQSARSNLG